MRKNLGDQHREIGEIVKLYGRFVDGDPPKIFDNADSGYTRVTVDPPLRLCYAMTVDYKARFLDTCLHLLDDVQEALGCEPQRAALLAPAVMGEREVTNSGVV